LSVPYRRVGADKPPLDALWGAWQTKDSLLYCDESDGLSLLPESSLGVAIACRDTVLDKLQERSEFVEEEDWKKDQDGVEKVEDELNELLACMEEDSAVEFSVFMQDKDAANVEDISQVFADLEDIKLCTDSNVVVTASSPVDVVDTKQLETDTHANVAKSWELLGSLDDAAASQKEEDAANVAMLSEILPAMKEHKDVAESDGGSAPSYSLTDCEDAKNVDLVADLFASLEESGDAGKEESTDRSATQDWIDALEVDNVATLFSELEQAEKTKKTKSAARVDSRIFVPTFSVRIEGAQLPGRRPPVGPHSTGLLVGPPGVLLAGPPPPSREERVDRWMSKRKTRSLAARHPDPAISDTRRASAAKRQRVKGRFVSDTHSFVSITALQK
jgi:hypothetical protein